MLDTARDLIRPAMSVTEIVPAREQRDITFSVRGGLDGEAFTTKDVSQLLKVGEALDPGNGSSALEG